MSNLKGWKLKNGTALSILRFLTEYDTDECILWPYATKGKYSGVGGDYGHRVVCEWLHGPGEGREVRHGRVDGTPCLSTLCINPRHVQWGDRSGQVADQKRHGTNPAGERNPMAKLTPYAVLWMRSHYQAGNRTYKEIGEMFGVSTMTAFRAIKGESWN